MWYPFKKIINEYKELQESVLYLKRLTYSYKDEVRDYQKYYQQADSEVYSILQQAGILTKVEIPKIESDVRRLDTYYKINEVKSK